MTPAIARGLIVATASAWAPISLIREAWVPIRIGGIATVPSAKGICQTLRARQGQDPRRICGISRLRILPEPANAGLEQAAANAAMRRNLFTVLALWSRSSVECLANS